MEFCPVCSNMLYIKVDNSMIHYCKNCSYQRQEESKDQKPKHHLLSVTNLENSNVQSRYSISLNKNILHDPTLPHVNHLHCPSESCTKSKDKESEVIYIKYDEAEMRFVYFCKHCEFSWKN